MTQSGDTLLLSKVKYAVNRLQRKFINNQLKSRLNNHGMTVISANCVGAFILHDLGEPFNSPFVNLYLSPKDFIRYLQNITFYQQQPLEFIVSEKTYPVGKLADIEIHFMHYHTEQEAREKWQIRSARINPDNLFIIMTDKDGAQGIDDENLVAFDRLPFKNKVVFTHKPYPELGSAFYIKGFEQQNQVGDLFTFSGWNGMKYYDQFDYVSWFNQT
ncbi:exopolysaccharide biosynthesis protein [Rodentibacter caecimuris]|uniref:Exopolysaccharide biosynthesis protein n=1 Tax=Rodentibacter caecimuris TaxID=1796644 RepID=A0AAJ3K551_9PAST|nr:MULTISPECIES: DUF1919 domain-containing protein [Pasteurellaceae]AOF53883.1 Exopolysaccharide biosynthesis protein [Pasteurellaceae bacterium NI1060]MCR1837514.1 DUF1919 domain-containing protein [Pasteurella caecimuris]MCU0107624.1 DUF1919 domain-containing protein [Pasteurella caecimuris]OOF73166.1 exopolysaccharide biosynthesis protein [Rodentibacter heylii]OOF75331.1 exopolysaccharide biosynthesis protein [Rodentibacter heylii]